MDWEAFFAIGIFALIFGAVLLIPGLMWARKKARENPDVPAGMALTKTGFVAVGIVVLVLFTGISAQFWAPDTDFGKWMAMSIGRWIFAALLLGVVILIERLLRFFGIRMIALQKRK